MNDYFPSSLLFWWNCCHNKVAKAGLKHIFSPHITLQTKGVGLTKATAMAQDLLSFKITSLIFISPTERTLLIP